MVEYLGSLPTVHSDGRWISEEVSRVIEAIREYDHNLDVKWVPPDLREPDDPAFAIVERTRDGKEVVAFYVQNETEMNRGILARVIAADNLKHNVNDNIDALNAANKILAQKIRQDQIDEANDLAKAMWRSPLHTYRHNGKKLST